MELGPLQREWVRALRSGDFPQGTHRLFGWARPGEVVPHCCLGVACCVAADNGVPLRWTTPAHRSSSWLVDGEESVLPASVVEAMKFRSRAGRFTGWFHVGHVPCPTLVVANDSGATFDEIADFVETYPEYAFTEPA